VEGGGAPASDAAVFDAISNWVSSSETESPLSDKLKEKFDSFPPDPTSIIRDIETRSAK
jgi:predicted methyltransferase